MTTSLPAVCGEARSSVNSDLRRVLRTLRRAGYTVEHGRHIKVYQDDRLVAVHPNSPSDQRGWRNFLADLRRRGVL